MEGVSTGSQDSMVWEHLPRDHIEHCRVSKYIGFATNDLLTATNKNTHDLMRVMGVPLGAERELIMTKPRPQPPLVKQESLDLVNGTHTHNSSYAAPLRTPSELLARDLKLSDSEDEEDTAEEVEAIKKPAADESSRRGVVSVDKLANNGSTGKDSRVEQRSSKSPSKKPPSSTAVYGGGIQPKSTLAKSASLGHGVAPAGAAAVSHKKSPAVNRVAVEKSAGRGRSSQSAKSTPSKVKVEPSSTFSPVGKKGVGNSSRDNSSKTGMWPQENRNSEPAECGLGHWLKRAQENGIKQSSTPPSSASRGNAAEHSRDQLKGMLAETSGLLRAPSGMLSDLGDDSDSSGSSTDSSISSLSSLSDNSTTHHNTKPVPENIKEKSKIKSKPKPAQVEEHSRKKVKTKPKSDKSPSPVQRQPPPLPVKHRHSHQEHSGEKENSQSQQTKRRREPWASAPFRDTNDPKRTILSYSDLESHTKSTDSVKLKQESTNIVTPPPPSLTCADNDQQVWFTCPNPARPLKLCLQLSQHSSSAMFPSQSSIASPAPTIDTGPLSQCNSPDTEPMIFSEQEDLDPAPSRKENRRPESNLTKTAVLHSMDKKIKKRSKSITSPPREELEEVSAKDHRLEKKKYPKKRMSSSTHSESAAPSPTKHSNSNDDKKSKSTAPGSPESKTFEKKKKHKHKQPPPAPPVSKAAATASVTPVVTPKKRQLNEAEFCSMIGRAPTDPSDLRKIKLAPKRSHPPVQPSMKSSHSNPVVTPLPPSTTVSSCNNNATAVSSALSTPVEGSPVKKRRVHSSSTQEESSKASDPVLNNKILPERSSVASASVPAVDVNHVCEKTEQDNKTSRPAPKVEHCGIQTEPSMSSTNFDQLNTPHLLDPTISNYTLNSNQKKPSAVALVIQSEPRDGCGGGGGVGSGGGGGMSGTPSGGNSGVSMMSGVGGSSGQLGGGQTTSSVGESVLLVLGRLDLMEKRDSARYADLSVDEQRSQAFSLKQDADRIRESRPMAYPAVVIRAAIGYILLCHVSEGRGLDRCITFYKETVNRVSSWAKGIDQVYRDRIKSMGRGGSNSVSGTGVDDDSGDNGPTSAGDLECWKTLYVRLCTRIKAVLCYRQYAIQAAHMSSLRKEFEKDLKQLGVDLDANSGNKSTPNPSHHSSSSSTNNQSQQYHGNNSHRKSQRPLVSPALSDLSSMTPSPCGGASTSSAQGGSGVTLPHDTISKLRRYMALSQKLQLAHEYWQHADTLLEGYNRRLGNSHGSSNEDNVRDLEQSVVRACGVHLNSPSVSIPLLLRYLQVFLRFQNETRGSGGGGIPTIPGSGGGNTSDNRRRHSNHNLS